MKKIKFSTFFYLLLVVVTVFGFVSCGEEEPEPTPQPMSLIDTQWISVNENIIGTYDIIIVTEEGGIHTYDTVNIPIDKSEYFMDFISDDDVFVRNTLYRADTIIVRKDYLFNYIFDGTEGVKKGDMFFSESGIHFNFYIEKQQGKDVLICNDLGNAVFNRYVE